MAKCAEGPASTKVLLVPSWVAVAECGFAVHALHPFHGLRALLPRSVVGCLSTTDPFDSDNIGGAG